MKIFESIADIDVAADVWQKLAASDKPVVMYGMGNGADKITEALGHFGVEVADYFASDGFVRGQSFHGKRVLSYAEVCGKYPDFIVVVSFGTRLPEVAANIERIADERELYIPDVPVVCENLCGELFDLGYFRAHRDELSEVCDLLADEQSRRVFCDVVAYRLTGEPEPLLRHTSEPEEVYRDILGAEDIVSAADLGAYDGDSIRELAGFAPKLSRVTALEPDARNFRKLTTFAGSAPYRVDTFNAAAWDADCELGFTSGGNRNSTLSSTVGLKTGAKLKSVQARRLDSLLTEPVDYIKYDVEGAEYEALRGSQELITRCRPRLLVSLYHRSGDLFSLPLLVRSMGYEKLYIRRYRSIPAWDLMLIAK